MKLVPGTLYFIAEVDVLTGEKFDYYKIGLVKDSRQGDSFDRAGEHQTGNPRRLEVRHTVESPAINDLETTMHDLYATERIFGEWFVLPKTSVKSVVAKAEELAREQQSVLKAARTADKYAAIASTDRTLAATPTARSLYIQLQQAKLELKEIKKAFDAERAFFLSLANAKFDTSLFFTTNSKVQTKFDEEKLAEQHPEIYEKFLDTSTTLTSSFTSPAAKDLDLKIPTEIETAVEAQIGRISKASRRPSEASAREIHFNHLALLSLYGQAEWRSDLITTQIKALMKDALAIESVARWSRSPKESVKFLFKEFRETYPRLAEELAVRSISTASAISDIRSYRVGG
jgi:Meiotically up-regulated gene 113